MKPKIHIASCSFGKDSIATILLALEHNEPLDRVVFSEVMFDISRNISGEIPEHIEWIYSTAIPKLEQMGVKVDIVRADTDYMYWFHHIPNGKYYPKREGFLIGGMCKLNSMCKIKPIKQYYKNYSLDYDIVEYVGIASDEVKRLQRLTKKGKVSLLAKYGYTEQMAMELCRKYDLVSPIYKTGTRGGCWFCPNAKIKSFAELKNNHPHLWQELVELSKESNLISKNFKYGMTLQEVERKINLIEINNKLQLRLEL
jgi:3'-phosphoadenosine 5'-phosphosulfate sulfotransferase (PAPS reductase)/FAD synthetase